MRDRGDDGIAANAYGDTLEHSLGRVMFLSRQTNG